MADVYNPVPTVAPSVPGPVYQNLRTPQVSPATFGAQQGEALEQVGQGLKRTADFFGEAAADNASNQYQEGVNKILHGDPNKTVTGPDGKPQPDLGYLGLKGRAAMDARPGVTQQMEDLRKQIMGGMKTPQMQLRFDSFARRYKTYSEGQIGTHADNQSNMWYSEVNKASADNARTHIATHADNPDEVMHGLSDLEAAHLQQARLMGGGPVLEQQALQKAHQEAVEVQVNAIAVSDPAKAMRILQNNKESAGTKYDDLYNKLDTRVQHQTGTQVANAYVAGTPPPNGGDSAGVLRHFEGFKPQPYKDTDGKLRVGYGSDTITRPDGSTAPVTADTRVTMADAERDLTRRVGESQADVRKKIGTETWMALPPTTKASLTSIAYNYGSLPDRVVDAAKTRDPQKIAEAVRMLSSDNAGINAKRRADEAANITNAPVMPGNENLDAADKALGLTPQEKNLWAHHRANLEQGGVHNPDGTTSTLSDITIESDGKTFVIPTIWDNKRLPNDQAVARARAEGLDKFPSYGSEQEAAARYDKMHDFLEKDIPKPAAQAPGFDINQARQRLAQDPYLQSHPQAMASALGQLSHLHAGQESERATVGTLMRDDLESVAGSGQQIPSLTPERVAAAMGPAAAEEFTAHRQVAQNYHFQTKDWPTLSAPEVEDRVALLVPKPGQGGYAYAQTLHDHAVKMADDLLQKRYADPAGSVETTPGVAQARAQVKPNDPTTFMPLVKARLMAQDRLLIPEGAQSPITEAEAKRYAATLRPASRDQADAATQDQIIDGVVKDVTAKYGRYSQRAMAQVLYHVTMKRDASDVLAAAMQRYANGDAGAVVTPAQTAQAQRDRDAQRAAAIAGQQTPATEAPETKLYAQPPEAAYVGAVVKQADAPTQKPFADAVDKLRANPGPLMAPFIKRFGIVAVPPDLRSTIPPDLLQPHE